MVTLSTAFRRSIRRRKTITLSRIMFPIGRVCKKSFSFIYKPLTTKIKYTFVQWIIIIICLLVDSLTWSPYCCTFGSCYVRELSKRCNLFCRIIYCKIVAFTVSKNWILQNISCLSNVTVHKGGLDGRGITGSL